MLPVTPDRIAKLREFGLSEYAARAYLALLDLGTTEARDVSGLSKVPASKIYHILDQLHEKGLVEILPEFPRKYAPVPFEDYLDRIQAEHENAALALKRERAALLDLFALTGDVTGGDRGGVTLLRGRRNVLDRFDDLLRGAKREIFLLGTPGLLVRQRAWLPLVREAAARGVAVRLLVPAPLSEAEVPPVALVRLREDEGAAERGAILLVDGARALLAHFLPDDGHSLEGSDTAVYTDQEGVVAILASLAGGPWRHATPLASARIPVEAAQGL